VVKRVIRRSFRLVVLAGLFWLGRTAFKRWVEGPEVTGSGAAWPAASQDSPVAQRAAASQDSPVAQRAAASQDGPVAQRAAASQDGPVAQRAAASQDGPVAQSPAAASAAAPPPPVALSPRTAASSSTADEITWVRPDGEGEVPDSHPVKAKVSSRVYRVPGMATYDQTKADRCYATPEAAEADGFTKAKR
jgi:hypothetical protein